MNNKVKAFVYVSKAYWDEENQNTIIDSFEEFAVEHDKKAAIGAGADGLLPSLDVLIVISAALGTAVGNVAGGFLNAIGEDAWKALKASFKKAKKVKPDRFGQEFSKHIDLPRESEIIWWIHFDNAAFLIHLPGDYEEWDDAFETLPNAIEETFLNDPGASRLLWDDGKWKSV